MKREMPLTPEQRVFAAEHHDLVLDFLRQNDLSEDEYYDVVVFGYLRAVRRYFTEPELRKFQFSVIAWSCMKTDLVNDSRAKARSKRGANVTLTLISVLADAPEEEQPEWDFDRHVYGLGEDLLLHDLARRASAQQMDAVHMRSRGYNVRDIARCQQTSMAQVRSLLDEACELLKVMCRE